MTPIYFKLRFLVLLSIVLVLVSCHDKKDDDSTTPPQPSTPTLTASTPVKGYGMLTKLMGIWNGPVNSTTALGSFPEWIVDFRPVSAAQVSGKSELDSINDIFMNFFLVLHGGEYKIAFRNGGFFAGNTRVTFMVADSVSETAQSDFYRFVDAKAGRNRLYSEFTFRADSLILRTYTNHYNSQPSPTLHFQWAAKRRDNSSCQVAITQFQFPQKVLVKDLSHTFDNVSEAIYYNNTVDDPYNESQQPYLGRTTVNVSYSSFTPNTNNHTLLLITTQPLFSGFTFNPAQLDYRSRYVVLGSPASSYTFTYMHPGSYYLYALYDSDGNYTFNSGDYISSNLNNTFTLNALGQANVNTTIDFMIP